MTTRVRSTAQLMPWLQLIRAPALFSAMSNVLAAQLIVSEGRIDLLSLAMLASVSACLYAAGMILNDCFDFNEDLRDRPQRPLPAGTINLAHAWMAGIGLLATGLLVAAALGGKQLLIAANLAGLILLYNAYAKHTWLGPWVMGACRYLNWLLGLSTAVLTWAVWVLPLPVFLYIAALTRLSRGETVDDSRPDRYAALSMILPGLILLGAYALLGQFSNPAVVLVLLIAGAWLLYSIAHNAANRSASETRRLVATMIFAIIPFDALLASAAGPWWAGLLVALLLLPARLLGRSMYVT